MAILARNASVDEILMIVSDVPNFNVFFRACMARGTKGLPHGMNAVYTILEMTEETNILIDSNMFAGNRMGMARSATEFGSAFHFHKVMLVAEFDVSLEGYHGI